MKREPIKAKKIGCGNCSKSYEVLPLEYIFYGSCNINVLRLDGKCIYIEDTTLEDVLEKYRSNINNADCVEISIFTALHDETYELNKETNEFVLVEQGMGYA